MLQGNVTISALQRFFQASYNISIATVVSEFFQANATANNFLDEKLITTFPSNHIQKATNILYLEIKNSRVGI